MSEDNNIKQNFRVAWGRLIRIPNLFTVPGDPIAGALLAAGLSGADIVWKSVFAASLCSLFFYTAGLIDNDLADLDEDMRERPDRPLCSGVISILSARIVSVLLFLAGGCLFFFSGAGVAALSTALLLLCFILLYNRLKKTGGGCKAGSIYGATDDFGYHVVDGKMTVYDLWATVLHLMGIEHEDLTFRYAGRDVRLSEVEGHVIHDLVG